AITPGIADVVAADASTALTGGRDHFVHVVDDETEMPIVSPRLDLGLEESDELVAEVDEGHSPGPAAQLQIWEERSPELERLVEAAHVERDMIDPQRARHYSLATL